VTTQHRAYLEKRVNSHAEQPSKALGTRLQQNTTLLIVVGGGDETIEKNVFTHTIRRRKRPSASNSYTVTCHYTRGGFSTSLTFLEKKKRSIRAILCTIDYRSENGRVSVSANCVKLSVKRGVILEWIITGKKKH
jgi:hypothetical protein